MKAIWSGSISFGLINIPIKIYSASERNRIDLDMLDESDHARIRYQRVNEETGEEVEWENIVKGYLLDDEYVVLDDEDFEKAESESLPTYSGNAKTWPSSNRKTAFWCLIKFGLKKMYAAPMNSTFPKNPILTMRRLKWLFH